MLEDSLKSEYDFVVWPIQMRGHLMEFLVNRVGMGRYRFEGYVDGKAVGSTEFEIAP